MKKILSVLTILAFFSFAIPVSANPMRYVPSASTATATSTVTFMTPGAATTTLAIDSYANGQTAAFDKAILMTQFTGSSTNSVLNIGIEYSMGVAGVDCTSTPTACDWYKDNQFNFVNATTSAPYSIAVPNSYSWKFASSTQGGATTPTDRALNTVTIPVVARYVRVIYTMATANGAIWGTLVPIRQSN